MERDDWIALCAHRLHHQWRTVDPDQLDELATDLWGDERLRAMAPAQAAVEWLAPVTLAPSLTESARQTASSREFPGR